MRHENFESELEVIDEFERNTGERDNGNRHAVPREAWVICALILSAFARAIFIIIHAMD